MTSKCNKKSLYINLRYFSSIFDVIRTNKCRKLEESHINTLSKPNITVILKRYEAIEPIEPNITKNEFIKKVDNLRYLTMDTLSHLPYYKCEDISAIIKFLSKIKYRDIILLQGLCESLYWQCNLNKARLRSITSVLSNLANLLYVPHLRITKTFCDQLDNPKNRQSIGDYTRIYKFLVFTNLMDSNNFIQLYQRIEQKCLNSMGLMNHSQLALMSTILQFLPGGKWELMDKICANFQRKLHEIPMDSFVILLKNINKLKSDFKLAPRQCPLLISQIVNNRSLDNVEIITILQTMSIYYIRDPPILSKLGKLISERHDFTLDQQILILNIFSQLNYKHKEFLSTRPLKTISDGISKLRLIVNCKSLDEIKELYQDFYQYLSAPAYKFIQYSIAYINCLAKVGYNKRECVIDALDIIKHCNIYKDDFPPLKKISNVTRYVRDTNNTNFMIEEAGLINDNSSTDIDKFVKLNYNTTEEIINNVVDLVPQQKDILPKRLTNKDLLLSRFNYSKTGLLRIDSSVKNLLQDIAIKNYKPAQLIIPKVKVEGSPFDSLEEFKASKVVDRGGIHLPVDCKVYRTKSIIELYNDFWNRTYGEYVQHPANNRLQNRRLYKTMINILYKKKNKRLKHYQNSKLYGNEIVLETSSGITDKEEIRKLFIKRRKYSGSRRGFESNLTYVNKWRLLRRCFLKPYANLYNAFQSYNKDDENYLNSIIKIYKNHDFSGFSFDSFITNSKNHIIYDTKPILEPISHYVRMGKTVREFKKIRDRYIDKWKDDVTNIIQLNCGNSASSDKIGKIGKSNTMNKNLKLLIGGLESLIKLDCQSHKYLYYVIRQIKKIDGQPIEQLTLANRLHRAIINYNVDVLEKNKSVLMDLYGKYIPMIEGIESKMDEDVNKFMYTIGNSLNIIQSIGGLNELNIDFKQLKSQLVKMKERLSIDSGNDTNYVKLQCILNDNIKDSDVRLNR